MPMKIRPEFSRVLMLLLMLVAFSSQTAAQPGRNLDRDLSSTFSSMYQGFTDPGVIFGTVTNKSVYSYPCVRLEFTLYVRYDHQRAGQPSGELGTFSVDVQNVTPRAVQNYRKPLPYPAGIGFKSQSVCAGAEQPPAQNVVIYERPNFGGRSRSFGIGRHRLFNAEDFNDQAASIRVPDGFVAVVYEHSDEGGGYGTWVDFLEDQPDLSKYNFHGKISFLDVFRSQRKTVTQGDSRPGVLVYARNSIQNGQFVSGHWERERAAGNPVNPNPVVGPAKPPNTPPTPRVCTISGIISRDKPEYATRMNLLRDDGSRTVVMWAPVNSGRYGFRNVPVGKYVLVPKGNYPTGEGQMGGLAPYPWSEQVTCEPNGAYTVNFKIQSTEG
jgi:hypothetical protein